MTHVAGMCATIGLFYVMYHIIFKKLVNSYTRRQIISFASIQQLAKKEKA